jgi:DNA modification methylase
MNYRRHWTIPNGKFHGEHFAVYPSSLIETPIRAGCPEQGIVLDPFMGSGTTALEALKQNKKFVGIELNSDYIKIAEKRIKDFIKDAK